MKKRFGKREKRNRIVLCTVILLCAGCILWTGFALLRPVLSGSGQEAGLRARLSGEAAYEVHYVPNDVYESQIMPQNLQYMMSFTDFIEVQNSFSAELSAATEVSWQYTATEIFTVRNQLNSGGNPVVFEKRRVLAEESGSVSGSRIILPGEEGQPVRYRVDPRAYLTTYWEFYYAHRELLEQDKLTPDQSAVFSADVTVAFTCHIQGGGLNETLTRGVSVPILHELYNVEETGEPGLEAQVPEPPVEWPEPSVLVPQSLWIALHLCGVGVGVRKLKREPDAFRRELSGLLGKYGDEIVQSAVPLELSAYWRIPVPQFGELLKVAVSQGKHILCYKNNAEATFCVIADGCAYCYRMRAERMMEKRSGTGEKSAVAALPEETETAEQKIL